MKKIIIAIIIAAALVGGFIFVNKPADDTITNQKSTPASKTTSTQTFSDVQVAVAKGGQLLDVRTAQEYAADHIDGAVNFPLQTMQAGTMPSGSKSQAIFVYCHSGNRAGQAATILKHAGYTNVTNLGAITHVESIGGKLVTGS